MAGECVFFGMKLAMLAFGTLLFCGSTLHAEVPKAAADGSLQLTLPETAYATVGVPFSIYFDNIVLTPTPQNYRFEMDAALGQPEARRWTVTPTAAQVGNHPLVVRVKDAKGALLAAAKTTLKIARSDAGAGRPLRLLIVGDSLTHASLYPNEIARLLNEPGNPRWTMLGTHKPSSAAEGVAHEGYGGWTWASFLTKYDAKSSAPPDPKTPPRKSMSPFLYPGADGKPVLDLPRYFRENCADQPPDVVTFLLGINDCFGAKVDDPIALDEKILSVLENAEQLIGAFHQAAPKAVFAVGLTTPPNDRQAAFVANYQEKYTRWGWKRIQHRLVHLMLQRFAHREKEGIHLVPTELNLDPIDGYPVNNGVHPNAIGYAQVGASFYAWMKNWLATQPGG